MKFTSINAFFHECNVLDFKPYCLQGSKDGTSWVTLHSHEDDCTLNEPGSTATWPVDQQADETQGYRHIRIQQTGKNASGQTHYLSLSGLELYGIVTGVFDELGELKNPFI